MNTPSSSLIASHIPEAVIFDGETWKIVCPCGWECWAVEDEDEAWDVYDDHVTDEVRSALARVRNEATVTRL